MNIVRKYKKYNSQTESHIYKQSNDPSTQPICARFGCGRQLTNIEQLAGRYCNKCEGIKRIDIMKVLKLP